MSSTYARARSTEAPMPGLEFTSRSSAPPVWRTNANNQNSPVKRTHSIANPPPSPFNPRKDQDSSSRPIFGENVRCLFNPPPLSPSVWSTPAPDTPEIDMRDVEVTPPSQPNFRGSLDVEIDEPSGNDNESPERRLISNAAVRRIARRRVKAGSSLSRTRSSKLRGKSLLAGEEDEEGDESSDDEDYDEDGSPKKALSRTVTRNTSNHYTLNMPGPAPVKGDAPYILLGYLQFMFNLSLILVFLYLLVQFIFTVQRDVEERIGEYSMEIRQEIATCAHLYKQNLCAETPIPAMLSQCSAWETCMSRDPSVIGRAKVGAEMLAEVVNGFVEPISWKTLLFTLSSLAFLTVFVNAIISLYRSKYQPHRQTHTSTAPPQPIPHFPPFSAYGYLPATGANGKWPSQSHLSWHPESELETLPKQRRRLQHGDTDES